MKKILSYITSKETIHFLHIGKTGGTSLKVMLESNKFKKFNIIVHSHEFTFLDVPKNDLVIFFLRNPIDRFVSGFYSRKRKGQPTYNVPWNEEEKIAFETFETPNALAEKLSSEINVEKKQAIFAMNAIRHVNTHFNDWLVDENFLTHHKNQIFYIGFQESFEEDIKKLYNKLTKKHLNTNIEKAHQTNNMVDKTLSDKAIENLTKWYANDLKMYAFCKQLILK